MKPNTWTEEEINFLKENYQKHGINYCTEKLNYSKSKIFNKTHELKLKLNSKIKSSILSKPNHLCNINPDLFYNIKRCDVAYLLGFIWSDGFLQRNKSGSCSHIGIKINETDMGHLKEIFNNIGKWNYHTRKYGNNWKNSVSIMTNNKRIYDFLIENDYDKKSHVSPYKILNKIPDNLKPCFYLGVIDGDGCFYYYKSKTGSKITQFTLASSYEQDWSYMEDLCKLLEIKYSINKVSRINKKTNKLNSSSQFRITNKPGIIKLGEFIYNNKFLGLNRKWLKYIDIINS